jgi:hypothetical protein
MDSVQPNSLFNPASMYAKPAAADLVIQSRRKTASGDAKISRLKIQ